MNSDLKFQQVTVYLPRISSAETITWIMKFFFLWLLLYSSFSSIYYKLF